MPMQRLIPPPNGKYSCGSGRAPRNRPGSNGLVLMKAEFVQELRELDPYLDLAGCEGEQREQARALAPRDYTAELGWYLLRRA